MDHPVSADEAAFSDIKVWALGYPMMDRFLKKKEAAPLGVAKGAKEVWLWDVAKLKARKGQSDFLLHTVEDIYSKRVVCWCVQHADDAGSFCDALEQALSEEELDAERPTLHAGGGARKLAEGTHGFLEKTGILGLTDVARAPGLNAFKMLFFKRLKNHPPYRDHKDCFVSIDVAQDYCEGFFYWYNHDHYHKNLGFMKSSVVHFSQSKHAEQVRRAAFARAFAAQSRDDARSPA